MRFTWDPDKAASNATKHGVTFDEAMTVFADPLAWIAPDAVHPDRSLITGQSGSGKLLVTVFAEMHDDEIRIISARRSARDEP